MTEVARAYPIEKMHENLHLDAAAFNQSFEAYAAYLEELGDFSVGEYNELIMLHKTVCPLVDEKPVRRENNRFIRHLRWLGEHEQSGIDLGYAWQVTDGVISMQGVADTVISAEERMEEIMVRWEGQSID